MSGIRVDRLLTSTAVLLFLTAAAGGALADPKDAATPDTAVTSRGARRRDRLAPADTAQKPDQSTSSDAAVAAPAAPAAHRPRLAAAPAATLPPTPAPASRSSPDCADRRPAAQSRQRQIRPDHRQQADPRARSTPSMPAATTRRSGSPTARPMRAPTRRSPISAMSTPTGSIPPTIRCRISPPITDPSALANAEIQLTTSVLTYAHHAAVGRVHWSRVSRGHRIQRKSPGSGRRSRRHHQRFAMSPPRSMPMSRRRRATSR